LVRANLPRSNETILLAGTPHFTHVSFVGIVVADYSQSVFLVSIDRLVDQVCIVKCNRYIKDKNGMEFSTVRRTMFQLVKNRGVKKEIILACSMSKSEGIRKMARNIVTNNYKKIKDSCFMKGRTYCDPIEFGYVI
jgi:hypothetical protein